MGITRWILWSGLFCALLMCWPAAAAAAEPTGVAAPVVVQPLPFFEHSNILNIDYRIDYIGDGVSYRVMAVMEEGLGAKIGLQPGGLITEVGCHSQEAVTEDVTLDRLILKHSGCYCRGQFLVVDGRYVYLYHTRVAVSARN